MLIRQAAFEGKGTFLKGNLHVHTTRSDGDAKPDVTIRQYGMMGFDFLALTDHRIYNYENFAPESGVLIVPGMELDVAIPEARVHCVHVVAVGDTEKNGFAQDQVIEKMEKIQRVGQAQRLIDMTHQANNLPMVCHPEWSGTGAAELEELQDFSLMEIWNSGCAVENMLDTHAAYWDELLCHGRKIYGVATDDAHAVQHMGLGYIRVKAEKNVSSILDALKRGAFYASCGPEIYDFFVEDGKATVVCSPVEKIVFRHFRVPYRVINGNNIQAAQMNVIPNTNYIRAEVIDAQGRRAWTNPIFLDWEEK